MYFGWGKIDWMRSDSIRKYQTNKYVPKSSYKIYAWLTINTPATQYTHTTHSMCSFGSFRLCNIKYLKWKDDTEHWKRQKREEGKKTIHIYLSTEHVVNSVSIHIYSCFVYDWAFILRSWPIRCSQQTDMLPMSVLPFSFSSPISFVSLPHQLFCGALIPPLPVIQSTSTDTKAAKSLGVTRKWKKIRFEKYNFKHSSSLLNFISILLVRREFSSILRGTLLNRTTWCQWINRNVWLNNPFAGVNFHCPRSNCHQGKEQIIGNNNILNEIIIVNFSSDCDIRKRKLQFECDWEMNDELKFQNCTIRCILLFDHPFLCRVTNFELWEWHLSSDNIICVWLLLLLLFLLLFPLASSFFRLLVIFFHLVASSSMIYVFSII